jgi:hypothetical protein
MVVARGRQREWARLGAYARFVEIERERAEILRVFPELRRGGTAAYAAGSAFTHRRARTISAAARRAMREGMRKYWAKRKAQEKK